MHFDGTIHLSDLIVFGGGVIAFIKVFISVQNVLQKMQLTLGTRNPREGMLGDVEHLKDTTQEHHEWLIELRSRRP